MFTKKYEKAFPETEIKISKKNLLSPWVNKIIK